MPEEIDAFDAAVASAEAELSGGDVDGAESVPTVEVTEVSPSSESAPSTPSEPSVGEPAGEATPPWWQDRLDETVTVGDLEVPLRELQQGYLRQSDYTRKTQQVSAVAKQAQWAEDFQARLRQDPVGTLRDMAVELRLLPDDSTQFDPDEVNPLAAELHQTRQEINQVKLAQIEEDIRREVHAVRTAHADFDPEQILPLVAAMGEQGVGLTIEQGYYLWKGQQATVADQAAAAAKAKAEQLAAQQAAARQAQVASGHSPAADASDNPARHRSMSFEEIAEETWQELGMKD